MKHPRALAKHLLQYPIDEGDRVRHKAHYARVCLNIGNLRELSGLMNVLHVFYIRIFSVLLRCENVEDKRPLSRDPVQMKEQQFPFVQVCLRLARVAPYVGAIFLIAQAFILDEPLLSVGQSGLIILIMAIFWQHRQTSYFSQDPFEKCIEGGEYEYTPLHQLSKFRAFGARFHIHFILFGTAMAGWGVFKDPSKLTSIWESLLVTLKV